MKNTHNKKLHHTLSKTTKPGVFLEIFRKVLVAWFLTFFVIIFANQQELLQESFLIRISDTPDKIVFSLPGSPADWGIDSYELGAHSAAGEWDYLFEDTTGNQVYTPTLVSGAIHLLSGNTGGSGSSVHLTGTIKTSTGTTNPLTGTIKTSTGTIVNSPFTGSILTGSSKDILLSGPLDQPDDVLPVEPKKSCKTPWGDDLEHKDFVLAYKQRRDVKNICDVQKRYCVNGKLTGSYPQNSCKEDTRYSYTKQEVISYNQQTTDPFIQPGEPTLSGAQFDTHGKINGQQKPIDVWGEPSYGVSEQSPSVPLVTPTEKKCNTPWGELIKNTHIVKAYKAPVGLIDIPCEVEIRLCADGKLKGTFTNRTCTFKKMTYRDYMVGNYDSEKPTAGDLINAVQTEEKETTFRNSAFWIWLDIYF